MTRWGEANHIKRGKEEQENQRSQKSTGDWVIETDVCNRNEGRLGVYSKWVNERLCEEEEKKEEGWGLCELNDDMSWNAKRDIRFENGY